MAKLKSISSAIFMLLICATQLSAQQLADKIVGVVDDNIILLSDVESQYEQYKQQSNTLPTDIKCQILDQLMTEKLMITQATIDSVLVSDDEVNTELDRRIRYFSKAAGGDDKLEEYYGKSIVEIKEQFRQQIKDQLLAQREQQTIIGDVKVTPNEVKDFYNRIPADSLPFYNAEVEVGELVVYPEINPELKKLAYDKIAGLRKRVLAGEDFGTLATLYSEDPGSKNDGGDLGYVNRGDLDPAFEAAAFSLKNPGDVSDIIESSFGYHIIQLVERRGEQVDVRHILIVPKTASSDLTKASILMDSIRNLIISGKTNFYSAVNKFSNDETTKNNGGMLVNPQTSTTYFEVDQLGQYYQDIVFVIDTMHVGGFSKVQMFHDDQGKTAFRIIYLKSKSQPHKASLTTDYDKIQAAALSEKQDKVLSQWMMDRIAKTYVKVDDIYGGCDALDKWITKTSNN